MAACPASVNGKVLDENGAPIAGARVHLVEILGSPLNTNRYLGPFYAGADGKFDAEVAIQGPGTFFVIAKKEDSGYPAMMGTFYINREPQQFTLDCDSSHSGVIVTLGPKAAYIQQITVLDADTGQPITDAGIRLWRLSSPLKLPPSELGIGPTSAKLPPPKTKYSGIAVPSNIDVAYQISAPGYTTSPVAVVHLKPLQDFSVTVKLKAASTSSP